MSTASRRVDMAAISWWGWQRRGGGFLLRGELPTRQSCLRRGRANKNKGKLWPIESRTFIDNYGKLSKSGIMPLLHQDISRSGGSKEHRRSLGDFLGFEAPLAEPTPPSNHRGNECEEWRWEEPGSPEVAQTPRALVPAACFPPRHPRDYTSFSESARPGSGWSDENTNGQGITDLVASLKALAMPAAAPRLETSIQLRLSYDAMEKNNEQTWAEQTVAREMARPLPRRASFCGVLPAGRNGSGAAAARWSGTLPPRGADASGGYSPKVFLGGLPWDITEHALLHTLAHFQPLRVEWPGRECGAGGAGAGAPGPGGGGGGGGSPRGYAYVTFESERGVRALLAAARRDRSGWYYRVHSRKMRTKEVQVIPWAVSDCNWVAGGSARLEPARTVFVGALHGMLTARALAAIMHDLFQGVVYAGIDTDKNKYPIGSGRVTFNNVRSYVRAISAGYVEIHTDKFTKKVQVDPYLEDSMCSVCNLHQGPYFCREPMCFRYFCWSCWVWAHPRGEHAPLSRGARARHDAPQLEGTPSPSTSGASTSGTSGASGTEFEPGAGGDEPDPWPLH